MRISGEVVEIIDPVTPPEAPADSGIAAQENVGNVMPEVTPPSSAGTKPAQVTPPGAVVESERIQSTDVHQAPASTSPPAEEEEAAQGAAIIATTPIPQSFLCQTALERGERGRPP